MNCNIKSNIVIYFVLIIMAITTFSCGMKNVQGKLGFPDAFTDDYGKSKNGNEVILNKLEDQRKEKWFIEIHFGFKPKHIEFDPSMDFNGQVSNLLVNEFKRANFQVIQGIDKTDPVRPVVSGKITRYRGVFKQVRTAEINLDITITKGDDTLLSKTYIAIEERNPGMFNSTREDWSLNGPKVFDSMMQRCWRKLMAEMMPELIDAINKST